MQVYLIQNIDTGNIPKAFAELSDALIELAEMNAPGAGLRARQKIKDPFVLETINVTPSSL